MNFFLAAESVGYFAVQAKVSVELISASWERCVSHWQSLNSVETVWGLKRQVKATVAGRDEGRKMQGYVEAAGIGRRSGLKRTTRKPSSSAYLG